MSFINPISFGDYTSLQDIPIAVTLKALATSGTQIVSVLRYTYGGTNDSASTDISSRATINGQVVTLADMWKSSGDPKTVGVYRIQIVAKNTDLSAQDECNIFVNILY